MLNNRNSDFYPQSFYDRIYNEWLVTKVGGLEILKAQERLKTSAQEIVYSPQLLSILSSEKT